MAKSITITYNEADEHLLLLLFKKLKVKVKSVKIGDLSLEKDEDDDEGVPERVARDIVQGLKDIKNGVPGTDAYEFLAEMRREYPSKKETV